LTPTPEVAAVDALARRELLRILRREDVTGLVDDIVVRIGTDIIEARLGEGDDLNSVELARTFGTSRTPIREALLVLEREGLVDVTPHRRPRVAALSVGEARDLYRVRAHLHQMVSRDVVAVAGDADLMRLRSVQELLREAAVHQEVDRYFWLNVEFRNTEAEIARNSTLRRLLDSLGLRMLRLRHLSLSLPGRMAVSLEDHDRLIRAYEDREADLAAALTSSIALRGLRSIEGIEGLGFERIGGDR
jgi:DNA-binding GntR family transcriptional regulator